MMTTTEDPALWINKLIIINKRLGEIDKKYNKGDIELSSYIMANLPKTLLGNCDCDDTEGDRK
jgi:hypothetical protein